MKAYRLALAATVGLAGISSAHAAPIGDPFARYNVTHDFNFTPAGDVVSGVWNFQVATNAASPPAPCGLLRGAVPLPANQIRSCTSNAANGASAVANSTVATTNFAVGNVKGQIHVDGNAFVPPGVEGSALSYARSGVVVRGGKLMRNGRIAWGPAMSSQVSGNAHVNAHDPMSFDILDTDTGLHTTGLLEDIEADLDGTGTFSWSGNTLAVDADNFVFTIDLDSPYIPANERGTVDFRIANGIVTSSLATGIFSGLLPTVGSSGTFSTPFSNDLSLDYDFGNVGGNNPLVDIDLSNGGDAVIPEPGSLVLACTGLGLLGLVRRRTRRSPREG